jgi:predicted transcriptional regulator of viral defense system
MARVENVTEIFREAGGILKRSQAQGLGVDYRTLSRMMEAGLLVREGRGIYRLADLPPLGNPDLVQVALRVPKAVICLISALHFHNLTTQLPYRITIALPRTNKSAPRFEYPPLEVVWLSDKSYHAGIESHMLDGVPVRIYGREKTVADCFKFRRKIGRDVALEALKDYLRNPDRDLDALLRYARIDRVEKLMRPYIEAAI